MGGRVGTLDAITFMPGGTISLIWEQSDDYFAAVMVAEAMTFLLRSGIPLSLANGKIRINKVVLGGPAGKAVLTVEGLVL